MLILSYIENNKLIMVYLLLIILCSVLLIFVLRSKKLSKHPIIFLILVITLLLFIAIFSYKIYVVFIKGSPGSKPNNGFNTGPSNKPNPNGKGNYSFVTKQNSIRRSKKYKYGEAGDSLDFKWSEFSNNTWKNHMVIISNRYKKCLEYQEYYNTMLGKYLNAKDIAEIQKKTQQIKNQLYKWQTIDSDYFSFKK